MLGSRLGMVAGIDDKSMPPKCRDGLGLRHYNVVSKAQQYGVTSGYGEN